MLKPGIIFTKIWSDEDLLKLQVDVSDGVSLFSFDAYLGQPDLKEIVSDLNNFKKATYGGIYDLKIGNFGHEYGGGALCLRLHHRETYKIFATAKCQSDFMEFAGNKVASEATIYFNSAPLLMQGFVEELQKMVDQKREHAYLQAA